MHHPIQMKPADSENRNGKCFSLQSVARFYFDGQWKDMSSHSRYSRAASLQKTRSIISALLCRSCKMDEMNEYTKKKNDIYDTLRNEMRFYVCGNAVHAFTFGTRIYNVYVLSLRENLLSSTSLCFSLKSVNAFKCS